MSKIKSVKAREILDSRGYPTIEVEVKTEKGFIGVSSCPSGTSTGTKEALELRDNDERYFGKGVLKAVNNVNEIISKEIIGLEVSKQKEIDLKLIELDGTNNKSNLGANAILATSIACLKAASNESGKEIYEYLNPREKRIPKVMFNIINGGMHAKNNLDIQEFMIVPKKETFKESLRCACEIFHSLKELLEKEGYNTSVGDEGGFAPTLKSNEHALSFIIKSIESAGYKPGKEVFIALDIAASTLYNENKKTYKIDDKFLTNEELLDYYLELLGNYPIISLEDPFAEQDYEGFKLITEKLGKGLNIVGDDLFVTNKKELQNGIDNNMCNSILIKPNQIGTFLETLETIVLARKHHYTCIMSHRSGETNDTFIVDAAVALNVPFIKTGSVSRGERTCKFNRLLKIEEELSEGK